LQVTALSDQLKKTDLQGLNEKYLHIDPLRDSYRENIIETPQFEKALIQHKVALMVIDLQYLDAAEGYGVFADVEKSGVPVEAQEYYFKRLHHIVLPNVRRLQDTFRSLHAAPGSKEAEFLAEVAPKGDEIIINKTASGVFNSTNTEYILRNMEIRGLYVCGVYTNECVSTTVRDACDRGFNTTLIRDACATVTPELHNATISTVRDRYARVLTSDEVVKEVREAGKKEAEAKEAEKKEARQAGRNK
jgi:nicotinamidase-related amidase